MHISRTFKLRAQVPFNSDDDKSKRLQSLRHSHRLNAFVGMLQSPFICRSCLSRLRQAWRQPLSTNGSRKLAQAATQDAARSAHPDRNIVKSGNELQPLRSSIRVRKSGLSPRFRKYVPYVNKSAIRGRASRIVLPSASGQLDPRNYSPDDQSFWDRFNELWGETSERKQDLSQPDPAGESRPISTGNSAGPLQKRFRVQRQPRQPRWYFKDGQIFRHQLNYLLHFCDASEVPLARKRFWAWKRLLNRSWQWLGKGLISRHNLETSRLRWLLRHGDLDAITEAWKQLPLAVRRRWPNVVMSAIRSKPTKSHMVFEATFDATLTPSYVVQDLVHFFIRQRAATLPAGTHRISPSDLFNLVKFIIRNSPRDYLRLRQRTLFLLFSELEIGELAEFFHLLVEYQHPLHEFTLLQIASNLAKSATYKGLSADILQSMLQTTSINLNTPHGASLCTSLLSMNEEDADGDSHTIKPAELFELLLQCGLKPNLITYTTIIRGLCLNGDVNTAWEVFNLMISLKTEPDAYVYSTLLNGAKSQQNLKRVRQVVGMAVERGIRDPVVWNDFLQTIFLSALVEARQKGLKPPRVVPSFPLMMQTYTKMFDFAQLKVLLPSSVDHFITPSLEQVNALRGWSFFSQLSPTVWNLPQLPRVELINPTGSTLGTMLLGYVRAMSKPYDVIAFYAHFRKLLKIGHSSAVVLVSEQGTFVHDIVIKAICEWDGMLRVALDVVSDMLKDAAAAADKKDKRPKHPAPSIYTWSILLNGFMFHRQTKQGEKILQMMQQHGVQPTIVTWNTLASGYARVQDVGKTVSALQRLEQAGHGADDFTFKAFGYLQNKTAALNIMDAMIERKKKSQERHLEALQHTADDSQRLETEVDSLVNMMDEAQTRSRSTLLDVGDGGRFEDAAEERGSSQRPVGAKVWR